MTVNFSQMPATRRTPGRYIELNKVLVGRGLSPTTVTVLFIGQRLGSGVKSALDLVQVLSEADAKSYFGRGSVLARAITAAFGANKGLNAYAMALDDHASGVAHVQETTISGPAVGDGALTVFVAGDRVEVAYSDGDTAATVATAVAAAISTTLTPDLPMTVEVDGVTAEQLNWTARNDGTLGGQIDITFSFPDGSGLSVVSAVGTPGATDPALSDALDLVETEDFDFIVSTLNDATNLGLLETHLADLVHPLVSLGAVGVFATTGTYGAATTLAANFATSGFMTGGFITGTKTWSAELAGIYAGLLASQDDPAMPYNNLPLTGVHVPESVGDRLTAAEVEAALNAGVAPFVVGAGNKVRIVRAITTYTQNDAAESDDVFLDVTVARTLFWWRAQVVAMLALKYPRSKNTAARREAIRIDIISLAKQAEQLEILENVDELEDGFIVETNGSDSSRVDLITPIDIVNGLHILAGRIDMTQSL